MIRPHAPNTAGAAVHEAAPPGPRARGSQRRPRVPAALGRVCTQILRVCSPSLGVSSCVSAAHLGTLFLSNLGGNHYGFLRRDSSRGKLPRGTWSVGPGSPLPRAPGPGPARQPPGSMQTRPPAHGAHTPRYGPTTTLGRACPHTGALGGRPLRDRVLVSPLRTRSLTSLVWPLPQTGPPGLKTASVLDEPPAGTASPLLRSTPRSAPWT